jgi:hypothetical protein
LLLLLFGLRRRWGLHLSHLLFPFAPQALRLYPPVPDVCSHAKQQTRYPVFELKERKVDVREMTRNLRELQEASVCCVAF